MNPQVLILGGDCPYDSRAAGRLWDFPHFDIGNVFVFENVLAIAGLAAFGPISPYAEGAALDPGDYVEDADGQGGGKHENKGHRHAENGKDKEKDAADNLVKYIHRDYVDPLWGK